MDERISEYIIVIPSRYIIASYHSDLRWRSTSRRGDGAVGARRRRRRRPTTGETTITAMATATIATTITTAGSWDGAVVERTAAAGGAAVAPTTMTVTEVGRGGESESRATRARAWTCRWSSPSTACPSFSIGRTPRSSRSISSSSSSDGEGRRERGSYPSTWTRPATPPPHPPPRGGGRRC